MSLFFALNSTLWTNILLETDQDILSKQLCQNYSALFSVSIIYGLINAWPVFQLGHWLWISCEKKLTISLTHFPGMIYHTAFDVRPSFTSSPAIISDGIACIYYYTFLKDMLMCHLFLAPLDIEIRISDLKGQISWYEYCWYEYCWFKSSPEITLKASSFWAIS